MVLPCSPSPALWGLALVMLPRRVEGVEFPIFLIAIAVAVWFASVGPAIACVVLSTLAFNYYFTESYYGFSSHVLIFPTTLSAYCSRC